MKTLLYFTFLYVPDWLLYFLISIVAHLKSIYRIVIHFKKAIELYEGYRNGYPVKMLWIGTEEMKDYIVKMLYESGHQVTKLKGTNLISLQKTIDRLSVQCDLIYVERNSLLPSLKGFRRIKQALNTKARLEERNNIKYRRTMRLIAKNDIEFKDFKISKNIDQLRLFYDQLYAPHISSRYGETSVESFDSLKTFYAKGVLLLAYLKGEAIAGAIFLCQGDTLIYCKYGVRDANDNLHRAAGSCYSHMKYAEDNKFTHYDAFHVKPFFNDGVFRYKRDCGLSVQIDRRIYYFDTDLYLRVINYSSGVVDFLSANPFIFVRSGKLVASLLCHSEDSSLVDAIVRQYRECVTGGIARYEFNIERELSERERNEIYQRCSVSEENDQIAFINYNKTCGN
ncbi:MAG: hypothetical protein ACE5JB_02205 [bacterium]